MSRLPTALAPKEEDVSLLLAAQSHIGTKNCDAKMSPYVWKRRADGIHLINVGKTWEKLVLAARIIASIENPQDVVAISARPYGQRAVLKFAKFTGCQAIAGRFTPGNFTNYITRSFKEPRLIIVTDPRTDHQAIKEASYVNIPVIAFTDCDSPLNYIDVAIPTNNKGKHAIGLVWWLLAREIMRLRGTLARDAQWEVMTDLFFYRDPEEAEKEAEAVAEEVWQTTEEVVTYETVSVPAGALAAMPSAGGQWESGDWAEAPAPTGDWAADTQSTWDQAGQSNW